MQEPEKILDPAQSPTQLNSGLSSLQISSRPVITGKDDNSHRGVFTLEATTPNRGSPANKNDARYPSFSNCLTADDVTYGLPEKHMDGGNLEFSPQFDFSRGTNKYLAGRSLPNTNGWQDNPLDGSLLYECSPEGGPITNCFISNWQE